VALNDPLRNEEIYLETRAEQLLFALERSHGLSRRQLLKLGAAGLPLLAGVARLAAPQPAQAARADNGSPISKPLPADWFVNFGTNAEMRWDAVGSLGYTTPNERFFVRDHTGTPVINGSTWQLSVFGTGLKGAPDPAHAVSFSLADLQGFRAKTVTSFIECAGNGRAFFGAQQGTPAAGTQWHLGAIGVASWTGVPLSNVLERAGILPNAVDVMPAGLDSPVIAGGIDAGHVRRPIPVSKALDDVLLAYKMNGQPLPLDHGYPVRLVVPGWVGAANIKWVGQIEVSTTPLTSLWNTIQYTFTGPTYTGSPALTTQGVKSAFELALGAQLPVGKPQVLSGRSWSGNAAIHRVDVSVDNGVTWKPATLHGANIPKAWARWTYPWTPTLAGSYTLQARATDKAGVTQAPTVPFNDGGYLFSAIVRHPIVVS
jgi:DMSO/TMAO reductase YedYZ molybdopterin-dependent catalytic subunit